MDYLPTIYVRKRPGFRSQGWLLAGGSQIPVAVGRAGILALLAGGGASDAKRSDR